MSAAGAAQSPTLGVLTLAGLWLGIGLAADAGALDPDSPAAPVGDLGIASTPGGDGVRGARDRTNPEPVLARIRATQPACRGGRALGDPQVIATTTLAAYTANWPPAVSCSEPEDPRLRGGRSAARSSSSPGAGDRRAPALVAQRAAPAPALFADDENNSLKGARNAR